MVLSESIWKMCIQTIAMCIYEIIFFLPLLHFCYFLRVWRRPAGPVCVFWKAMIVCSLPVAAGRCRRALQEAGGCAQFPAGHKASLCSALSAFTEGENWAPWGKWTQIPCSDWNSGISKGSSSAPAIWCKMLSHSYHHSSLRALHFLFWMTPKRGMLWCDVSQVCWEDSKQKWYHSASRCSAKVVGVWALICSQVGISQQLGYFSSPRTWAKPCGAGSLMAMSVCAQRGLLPAQPAQTLGTLCFASEQLP